MKCGVITHSAIKNRTTEGTLGVRGWLEVTGKWGRRGRRLDHLVGLTLKGLARTHSRTPEMEHKYANEISGKEFLFDLNKNIINNLPKSITCFLTSIASLNKTILKEIAS